jgi:hypothetical protein
MSIIQIFNASGIPLTEISATVDREYVLNGVTRCTWTMALLDYKCREEYLQYGNLILIDDGILPSWCGVIDTDETDGRVWGGNKLKLLAKSAGQLFWYADSNITKFSGTAGDMFRQLLDVYNAQGLPYITPGDIWTGGPALEETLGQPLLDHVRRVQANSGNDWSVVGRAENGVLRLYANWHEKAGQLQNVSLNDKNLEYSDELYRETGMIYNDVRGLGDAMTSGKRLETERVVNQASIDLYGRRRASVVFSGVKAPDVLLKRTQEHVAFYSKPRFKFSATVANVNNLFAFLDVGNSYPFETAKAGFKSDGSFGITGTARLLSMKPDGAAEKVALSVEVV